MSKLASLLIATATATVLSGCYNSRVIAYSGQQSDWPTSPGAFQEISAGLPVYYGNPPRPYTYLARIEISTESLVVKPIEAAAKEAKKIGADAILILGEGSQPTGSFGSGSGIATGTGGGAVVTGSGFSAITYAKSVTAIAIKWKPQG